jgi:hypothetical protein
LDEAYEHVYELEDMCNFVNDMYNELHHEMQYAMPYDYTATPAMSTAVANPHQEMFDQLVHTNSVCPPVGRRIYVLHPAGAHNLNTVCPPVGRRMSFTLE